MSVRVGISARGAWVGRHVLTPDGEGVICKVERGGRWGLGDREVARVGFGFPVVAERAVGRMVERVSMMWLPKTMSGRRDAQNLIDQHSIVRRAKLRGEIPEMPVLVDFSAPAAEQ